MKQRMSRFFYELDRKERYERHYACRTYKGATDTNVVHDSRCIDDGEEWYSGCSRENDDDDYEEDERY